MNSRARIWLTASALLCALPASPLDAQPGAGKTPPTAADDAPPQTVLAPGLYLFQTRTRSGTCNDAPRTGYVTSAIATLDGVPGARTMTMQLLNSKYWPTWTLTIGADDAIAGAAYLNGAKDDKDGSSRFELRAKKDRFQGVGKREYAGQKDGKAARCMLEYDALLKSIDR